MRYHILTLLLSIAASLAHAIGADRTDQQSSPELVEAMLHLADGDEAGYRKRILALCTIGDTDAQIAYGRFLIAKREYGEAERWLTKAAATSSAEGQYNLGFLYLQVTPQRLTEAELWMEKARKQGHARASAVLQLLEKKSRIGPANQLSVLDILESTALLGRLKTEAFSQHDIQCTGHKPEVFQAAIEASIAFCTQEVHRAFGDWVPTQNSKEVGIRWGQCVNREILKPNGVQYGEYMRCRWSSPTSPQPSAKQGETASGSGLVF